jgi:hypothetical protein
MGLDERLQAGEEHETQTNNSEMKKYRVNKMIELQEHEIISETEKTITYRNLGKCPAVENKKADWHNWFDTKEEAKTFMLRECDAIIATCKSKLKDTVKQRAKIEKL